jgi:hypothetical protein
MKKNGEKMELLNGKRKIKVNGRKRRGGGWYMAQIPAKIGNFSRGAARGGEKLIDQKRRTCNINFDHYGSSMRSRQFCLFVKSVQWCQFPNA